MPVKWYGNNVLSRVRQAAMRGVFSATETVGNDAVQSMRDSPATGREYQRRGVAHTASSPGNPPRIDTGALSQSKQTRYNTSALEGAVNFSTEYAAPLEFGTSRIEPRPYARPALEKNRKRIADTIGDEIARELRKPDGR